MIAALVWVSAEEDGTLWGVGASSDEAHWRAMNRLAQALRLPLAEDEMESEDGRDRLALYAGARGPFEPGPVILAHRERARLVTVVAAMAALDLAEAEQLLDRCRTATGLSAVSDLATELRRGTPWSPGSGRPGGE